MLKLHPAATVTVDGAAAASPESADDFRCVYAHKPEWQRYLQGI